MVKWKVYLIVILVFAVGIAAAFFDYPGYANRGIDALNEKTPLSIPHVPEVGFRLGLDLQGGIHLVYDADLSETNPLGYDSAMQGLRDVIERRVNLFGITEPLVQTQGEGAERRLIVELAGVFDPEEAIQLIGATPKLDFRELKDNFEEELLDQLNDSEEAGVPGEEGEETGATNQENEVPATRGEETILTAASLYQKTELTGRFLEKAGLEFDSFTQEPIITLQFDEEGAELFEELTARNIGRPLAIFLDDVLLQEPIVQGVIGGGQAQITGRFTLEEAERVVRELNAGALPVDIVLISQNSVGPALGELSLQQSLRAGVVGLLLVVLFMILFYRLPGFLATIALFLYATFVLAILKLILVTFTLAGLAGLILSIGMAVDANILIFSRMREELKGGKNFSSALEEGFRRAWPSIRDGNITTLLVAFILFWFGSSFVQGFALTLSIGILVSMFSAMFITKNLLYLFVRTKLEKAEWLWA